MSNENPAVRGNLPEPDEGDELRPAVPPIGGHDGSAQQATPPGELLAPPQHPGAQLPPPQQVGVEQHVGSELLPPQNFGVELPPPQNFGVELPPPQHLGVEQHVGTAPTGSSPQHAGTAHQPAAPQHAGPELQGPAPGGGPDAVQHVAHQSPGTPEHLIQHSPHGVDRAAQHSPGVGPDAAASQHAGTALQGPRGPWRQLKALRRARPRLHMAIVGGSAAAAVALGTVVVLAQDDQKQSETAAVTTSTIVAPSTSSAPVVVPATRPANSTPATAAPPATVAPTTTEAPTTTTTPVAVLPSGAGDYDVTFSDFTINGEGFGTSIPVENQIWSFTGPCDGVGDCSISAAGEAVLTTGAVGSIFSGPGTQIGLVAAGNGTYTSTFEIPVQECGSATADLTITVSGGVMAGSYSVVFAGSGVCPLTAVAATFSGNLA